MATTAPAPTEAPETVLDDAARPIHEQGDIHHRLFFQLFKDGYSAEHVKGLVSRLLGLIDRRIPIRYPTTTRDITQRAMCKFLTDNWKSGAEDEMASLFKAYIAAGYINQHDTDFNLSSDPRPPGYQGPRAGTILQQAIGRSAPRVVQTLLEAGSDPRMVPLGEVRIRSGTQHALGQMVDVAPGDVIGYAEAYHEPGAEIPLLLRSSLMHIGIAKAAGQEACLQGLLVPDATHSPVIATRPASPSASPSTAGNRRIGL